MRQRTISMK